MEGWPPLFPDASVRGETANIDSDVELLARTHERNRPCRVVARIGSRGYGLSLGGLVGKGWPPPTSLASAVQGAGDIAGQISGAEIAGVCPAV